MFLLIERDQYLEWLKEIPEYANFTNNTVVPSKFLKFAAQFMLTPLHAYHCQGKVL